MKILFLHNRYLISGGEDVSTQSEIDLLIDHGHHVDSIIVTNDDILKANKINVAINTIWSLKFYQNILSAIENNNYDIIHVQNFFPQLSPSIFYAAKRKNVKVVMSVRNYRLICPNALLYTNGKVCEKCIGKTIPYPAIINKCYKDSYLASSVVATTLGIHNTLGTWANKIDGYIAISSFVKQQLVRGGLPEEKIFVKHNFVSDYSVLESETHEGYLYVGRLSKEKGIDLLVTAFLREELKGLKLYIVGDGPLISQVKDAQKINPLIIYLGRLEIDATYNKMARSKALIFPSQWHEPFGRTIVESFSASTPVIASAVGGVTELIKEEYNGFLFNPLKVDELIESILRVENHLGYDILRLHARSTYLNYFTGSTNYHDLLKIYQTVLSS